MSGSITFSPSSASQIETVNQTYTPLQPGVSVSFGDVNPAPYTTTVTFNPNDFVVAGADNVTLTNGRYTVTDADLGTVVNDVANLEFTPIRPDRTSISYSLSDANASAVFTDAITIPAPLCSLRGSRIATPTGEVPVERLEAGDVILTFRGEARNVVWIGTGQVIATPGRRNAATPVIVRKGALAENVPNHDLHITKAHGLYFDGALIPAEFLVNHRSILWDDKTQVVTLYHVELGTHDILIANGAPAETYRDDGNRWLFQNVNTGWHLPRQPSCVPVVTGGPFVDAVWAHLLDRSGPRPGFQLTDDPDLHLMINGRRVDAATKRDKQYMFRLPPGLNSISIRSREAVPAELGLARDSRSLGVAVKRIQISQGARLVLIEASNDLLVNGFHDYELDAQLRWTTGDAELPASLTPAFSGEAELVLQLGGTTCYPLLAEASEHVAAA